MTVEEQSDSVTLVRKFSSFSTLKNFSALTGSKTANREKSLSQGETGARDYK